MQLEGMILLLLIMLIIPILSIFSNDTAFFIIFSLVLSFSSMKNILTTFFPIVKEDDNEAKELLEEIEDNIDLNLTKLKKGLKTAKALVIILFYIYSCFFMDLFIYKAAASFIIVYWFRYISNTLKANPENSRTPSDINNPFSEQILRVLTNIISLAVIVLTVYNRFF